MQDSAETENQTTPVDIETVRKQLFDAVRNYPEAQQFFAERMENPELLACLFDISLGDFPDSVRMQSCLYLSKFPADMLRDYEEDLLDLQNEGWEWVSDHAVTALSKIQSRRALKYLVEQRIAPKLKLEGEALSAHLADMLADI